MPTQKWARRPDISDEYRCLLYLLKCGIHKEVPSLNCMQKADQRKVAEIANTQGILATIAYPLLAFWREHPDLKPDFADSLQGFVGKNRRKTIMMDMERERILAELESRGIWYLPLKGIIMKEMYPEFGMREMSDNDILYNPDYKKQVCDLFEQWGYDRKGPSAHISFIKGDYHFEMHTRLIDSRVLPHIASYYHGGYNRLVPVDGKLYEKAMRDEDFYIFMVVHAFKHYYKGGTGVRILADMKLYLTRKMDTMDWDYIREQFQILQLTEFERDLRELTLKVLPDSSAMEGDMITSLTDRECRFLYLFLSSGAYGTKEYFMLKKIGEISSKEPGKNMAAARKKYLLYRLFPGRERFRESNPLLYKIPILLPGFWFYRIGKMLLTKPGSALEEVRRVRKADDDSIRLIPK